MQYNEERQLDIIIHRLKKLSDEVMAFGFEVDSIIDSVGVEAYPVGSDTQRIAQDIVNLQDKIGLVQNEIEKLSEKQEEQNG